MKLDNKELIERIRMKIYNKQSTIKYYQDLILKQRRDIGLLKCQIVELRNAVKK